MARINKEWLQKQYDGKGENAPDEYVLEILRVGEKLLDLIDTVAPGESLDAGKLMHDAARNTGITGNMAAYVALIATKCSSRGEEFRRSWNKHNGNEDSKGVVNPAVFTISGKAPAA